MILCILFVAMKKYVIVSFLCDLHVILCQSNRLKKIITKRWIKYVEIEVGNVSHDNPTHETSCRK